MLTHYSNIRKVSKVVRNSQWLLKITIILCCQIYFITNQSTMIVNNIPTSILTHGMYCSWNNNDDLRVSQGSEFSNIMELEPYYEAYFPTFKDGEKATCWSNNPCLNKGIDPTQVFCIDINVVGCSLASTGHYTLSIMTISNYTIHRLKVSQHNLLTFGVFEPQNQVYDNVSVTLSGDFARFQFATASVVTHWQNEEYSDFYLIREKQSNDYVIVHKKFVNDEEEYDPRKFGYFKTAVPLYMNMDESYMKHQLFFNGTNNRFVNEFVPFEHLHEHSSDLIMKKVNIRGSSSNTVILLEDRYTVTCNSFGLLCFQSYWNVLTKQWFYYSTGALEDALIYSRGALYFVQANPFRLYYKATGKIFKRIKASFTEVIDIGTTPKNIPYKLRLPTGTYEHYIISAVILNSNLLNVSAYTHVDALITPPPKGCKTVNRTTTTYPVVELFSCNKTLEEEDLVSLYWKDVEIDKTTLLTTIPIFHEDFIATYDYYYVEKALSTSDDIIEIIKGTATELYANATNRWNAIINGAIITGGIMTFNLITFIPLKCIFTYKISTKLYLYFPNIITLIVGAIAVFEVQYNNRPWKMVYLIFITLLVSPLVIFILRLIRLLFRSFVKNYSKKPVSKTDSKKDFDKFENENSQPDQEVIDTEIPMRDLMRSEKKRKEQHKSHLDFLNLIEKKK